MTHKDRIALFDLIRRLQPNVGVPQWASTPSAHAHKDGEHAQWVKMRDALVEFCEQRKSRRKS